MAKKQWSRVPASITVSLNPEDIPPAPGVDVEAIKAGDDDPFEVVVEIPAGKSTRGWNYKPNSLKAIVDHVNSHTLSGILGHQKPEDVASVFVEPVTHWVGAKMVGETAYFRGIIDADAPRLKRWIRTKRIKQVSIFGFPSLVTVAGETSVEDYKPLSIDWTPLDRSGMPTRIVGTGEMDDLQDDEGGNELNWKELIAQILAAIQAGTVTLADVLAELDSEGTKTAAAHTELITKLKAALGVTEDSELLPAVEKAAEALKGTDGKKTGDLLNEVVKAKVTGEMAQDLVLRMIHPAEGATKELIAGEVDALLGTASVKEMISKLHTDLPPNVGGNKDGAAANSRRVSI
ncbi:transcriptional regulator [Cohnella silvisoli]|uniref:Transcriptional regulator n=1 Tax=Cohnella silvisoli TaxID=2873699 RepID=A0ABV1L3S1_9BACL|nr:transcriptional regulator [Cohnella silvisoli]MCD9025757.1 transcriptional regulator [Cohnella silvisoli]